MSNEFVERALSGSIPAAPVKKVELNPTAELECGTRVQHVLSASTLGTVTDLFTAERAKGRVRVKWDSGAVEDVKRSMLLAVEEVYEPEPEPELELDAVRVGDRIVTQIGTLAVVESIRTKDELEFFLRYEDGSSGWLSARQTKENQGQEAFDVGDRVYTRLPATGITDGQHEFGTIQDYGEYDGAFQYDVLLDSGQDWVYLPGALEQAVNHPESNNEGSVEGDVAVLRSMLITDLEAAEENLEAALSRLESAGRLRHELGEEHGVRFDTWIDSARERAQSALTKTRQSRDGLGGD